MALRGGLSVKILYQAELVNNVEKDGKTTQIQKSKKASGAKRKMTSFSMHIKNLDLVGLKYPNFQSEEQKIISKIDFIVQLEN